MLYEQRYKQNAKKKTGERNPVMGSFCSILSFESCDAWITNSTFRHTFRSSQGQNSETFSASDNRTLHTEKVLCKDFPGLHL
jgi:hypothetical protein